MSILLMAYWKQKKLAINIYIRVDDEELVNVEEAEKILDRFKERKKNYDRRTLIFTFFNMTFWQRGGKEEV